MTVELRWNRLIIATPDEDAFVSAFEDYLPKLLEMEYGDLECDIVGANGLGRRALELLAWSLVLVRESGHGFVLRVPADFGAFIEPKHLPPKVVVEVVTRMAADPRSAETPTAPVAQEAKRSTSRKPATEPQPPQDPSAPQLRDSAILLEEFIEAVDVTTPVPRRGASTAVGSGGWLMEELTGEAREIGLDMLIGRDPACDWSIHESTLSKRHFRIFVTKHRYHIQDLGSTNGTFLNFLELRGPPVPLAPGDRIAIAVTDDKPEGTLRFRFLDAKPPEAV